MSGTPTTGPQPISQVLTNSGAATNGPYAFSVSPDGLTIYASNTAPVAGQSGIQKFVSTDGGTSFAETTYTLSTGGDGTGFGTRFITVDYSGATPTVYFVSASGTMLSSVADSGVNGTSTGVVGTPTLLQTLGTDEIFKGIAFVPAVSTVPEPASLGIAAFAGTVLARRRRRA